MKVSEYASDVNLSVAEILKKCHELAINVNNKDDYLTDDDIIMLDNTINLISTDDEITFEEEEDIEDKVDEIMTSSRVDTLLPCACAGTAPAGGDPHPRIGSRTERRLHRPQ